MLQLFVQENRCLFNDSDSVCSVLSTAPADCTLEYTNAHLADKYPLPNL